MGDKDITEKLLEDYNDVFADIVNTLLFDGKEVIKPDELENTKDKSQYKSDDDELHEQERDVSKYWKKGKIKIALYGLENQTTVDKDMPMRVISYDGSSYKSQLLSKQLHYPVITLVLYFGTTPWDGPTSLYECIGSMSENLKEYVNDYKINIFQIAFLSEEKVKMFKSDFGIIADFFVQKRTNTKYIPSDKQIKYVDEFLKLMKALTGDKMYVETNTKGGVISMCDVIRGAKEEGRIEGLEEGRIEGRIESLYYDSQKSLEDIATIVKCPIEFVKNVLEKKD